MVMKKETKREILTYGMLKRVEGIEFTLRFIKNCNDPSIQSKMDQYDSRTCKAGGYYQFGADKAAIASVQSVMSRLDVLKDEIRKMK